MRKAIWLTAALTVFSATSPALPRPPEVRVLWPNGGEVLDLRQPVSITWSASVESPIGAADVLVSYDNGASFEAIPSGRSSSSVQWVPILPTQRALVRVEVVDAEGNAGVDESDGVFTVGAFQEGDGTGAGIVSSPLPTTKEDFFLPGTQPGMAEPILDPVVGGDCAACHTVDFVPPTIPDPIFSMWQGTMMANASRDPLFWACLAIAEQDAPGSGDLCLRCHIPKAWLDGRSDPTDGSAVLPSDRSGVSCNFCHRMVDPIFVESPGAPDLGSPAVDVFILGQLAALGLQPANLNGPFIGNGMYVVAPDNSLGAGMRGPRRTTSPGHAVLVSPFHRDPAFCGTCHDVSNPAYTRNPTGRFVPNAFNQRSGDVSPGALMPIERTYSEWAHSEFAFRPVLIDGYGWVQTCQDCHMAKSTGAACDQGKSNPRDDVAYHDLTGGNTWVPQLLQQLFPEIPATAFGAARARALLTLMGAAEVRLNQIGTQLRVRVFNNTGHKLPTGYPEGRRMWLQVKFLDKDGGVIKVSGDYNRSTGELIHDSEIKVYEAELGIDSNISSRTGIPAGRTFHFVLNNVVLKDNRIPPRGFTNEDFESFNGEPVGATYADRQHWDDTLYNIPIGAASANAVLYYQTASKEYIEFLRDKNVTNNRGQELYNLWLGNKSPPVAMNSVQGDSLELNALTTAFVDQNATGAASGTTWDDAFTTLQGALAIANGNECIREIQIAAGTYSLPQTPQFITFFVRPGLTLTGGYGRNADGEVVFAPEHFQTVIDGLGRLQHVFTINGEAIQPPARFERLTIRGGNAQGAQGDGGGMLVNSANVQLAFVDVVDNVASACGGGIFVGGGSLTFNNCTFRSNSAANGGGIYLNGDELTAISSTFSGNSASADGGAFYGALGASSFLSSAFSGNSAARGGAVYCDEETLEMSNCTLSANTATTRGGGIRFAPTVGPGNEVINSILWGNVDPSGTSGGAQVSASAIVLVVEYSCVQDQTPGDGSVYPGTGNIDADPLLADPAQGLLTIQPESPCIDAGDSARARGGRDLFSRARRIDDPETADSGSGGAPVVDMGAVEFARTLYVDQNGTGAVANGRSWSQAFKELRDAFDEALEPGSQVQAIYVAEGAYRPAPASDPDRSATFRLRDRLVLLGGFPTGGADLADRDPATHPAVLSGDLQENDSVFVIGSDADNSFHVVTVDAGATATLDGFTIRGGKADGPQEIDRRGGGVLVDGGTLRVVDSAFVRNFCRSVGGAAHVVGGGSLQCERTKFLLNRGASGGAIAVLRSSLLLAGCTFSANSATEGSGGAIDLLESQGNEFVNCVFSRNTAADAGGGVFNDNSILDVRYCTFSGNEAARAGGIRSRNATLAVHGSVLWGNRDDVSSLLADEQIFGFATVRYSCVEGGWSLNPMTDIGNIDLDPRFANAAAGDLRLTAPSPCIDAGDNDALPPAATTDVLQNPRRHDAPDSPDTGNGTAPIVDMGAYEFDESMVADGGGDGNGDGRLDGLDARAFLDAMTGPGGTASPPARHAFDADHDLDVDMIDYLAFLGEIEPLDPSATLLDLRVTSGAAARVRVPTGAAVEYEVRGVLGDRANLGLGALVFDLVFTGGDLEPLAFPSEMPMLSFVPLLGLTNPGGFGGTPVGGVLLQAGGSQNIWGTSASVVPYPIGRVIEGVAQAEIVIARGTLRAPDVPGTYLVDALNAAGATLERRPTVARNGLAPWTVGPIVPRRLASLEVEVTEPEFRRGDANGDGRLDVSDPVATLGALFLGSRPLACLDAADANDDGATDISDAVAVLGYLFLGSRAPPPPGPFACGPDPSADALDCESYEACP